MIVCSQCGKEIAEQSISCPSCGAVLPGTRPGPAEEVMNGPIETGKKSTKRFPFDSLYEEYIPRPAPIYDRIYAERPAHSVPVATVSQGVPASPSPVENAPGTHAPLSFRERFFPINTKRSLILEIALSLFTGIFGIGWLLIGNRRTGMFLLVTSLIFYAPLLIISYALAYFSYGLSVLCTGPFIVGAVALNAFMLHKTMQRKRAGRGLLPPWLTT